MIIYHLTSKGESKVTAFFRLFFNSIKWGSRWRGNKSRVKFKKRSCRMLQSLRGDVKIPTYKPHTNHKRSFVRSHTLAPTSICDLSHSVCRSLLTDLGHISSVTYVCHLLWFVCGHRKGILTSPLRKWPCRMSIL